MRRRKKDQQAIEAYADKHFGDMLKVEPYFSTKAAACTYAKVSFYDDPDIRWLVAGIHPDLLFSDIETQDYRRRFLSGSANKGYHQLIFPIGPGIYDPSSGVVFDEDRRYYEWIIKTIRLRPNDDCLVIGPGSGFDTWVVSTRRSGSSDTHKPIAILGKDPNEVACTATVADIAGFGIEAFIGDRLLVEDGASDIPVDRTYDYIFFNMQRVSFAADEDDRHYVHGSLFFDGDYEAKGLRRFAKALLSRLKPGGQALIWQPVIWQHSDIRGRNVDIIAEILRSGGDYAIERDNQSNRLIVERLESDVYLITRPEIEPMSVDAKSTLHSA